MNLQQLLQPGTRKMLAFLLSILLFTALLLTALLRVTLNSADLPAFAVQLATAYGILSALFFGSNVLEHFSKKAGGQ